MIIYVKDEKVFFKGFNPKDHKIKQRINSLYITVLILNNNKKKQVIDS